MRTNLIRLNVPATPTRQQPPPQTKPASTPPKIPTKPGPTTAPKR